MFDIFWKEKQAKEDIIKSKAETLNAILTEISKEKAEIDKSNNVLEQKSQEKAKNLKRLLQEEEKFKAIINQKNEELDELGRQEQEQDRRISDLMAQLKAVQDHIYHLQNEVSDKNKQNMENSQAEVQLKSDITGLINSIYQKKQILKENITEFEKDVVTSKSKKSKQVVFRSVAPGPNKKYYDPNVRGGCDCKCAIM